MTKRIVNLTAKYTEITSHIIEVYPVSGAKASSGLRAYSDAVQEFLFDTVPAPRCNFPLSRLVMVMKLMLLFLF